MYFLEFACAAQVRALGMGRPIHMPPAAAIDKMTGRFDAKADEVSRELYWPALLRKLDRIAPGYDA